MTRLDEIAKIFERLSEQDLKYLGINYIKTNYRRLFTARRNNKIVGYLAIYPGVYGYYVIIIVDPAYRRQGIASQLVRKAVSYFYQRCDIDELCWSAEPNNKASINLALKFGFEYQFDLPDDTLLFSIRKEET